MQGCMQREVVNLAQYAFSLCVAVLFIDVIDGEVAKGVYHWPCGESGMEPIAMLRLSVWRRWRWRRWWLFSVDRTLQKDRSVLGGWWR